jgi:putrescine---pyruvate transaminase
MSTKDLASLDQQHQIHSLHHPTDIADSLIYESGNGIYIRDIQGREYIDGLSGLWNVNVGHGRAELADAAADQMRTLAYFSGYAGSATVPSILLAERLHRLRRLGAERQVACGIDQSYAVGRETIDG